MQHGQKYLKDQIYKNIYIYIYIYIYINIYINSINLNTLKPV